MNVNGSRLMYMQVFEAVFMVFECVGRCMDVY